MGFVGGDGILAHSDRDEPTRPRRVANVDLSVIPSLPVFIAVRRLTTGCRGSSRPGWRLLWGSRRRWCLQRLIASIPSMFLLRVGTRIALVLLLTAVPIPVAVALSSTLRESDSWQSKHCENDHADSDER